MILHCEKCARDHPHQYTGDLRCQCRECGHVRTETHAEPKTEEEVLND